ncbi:cation-translocating P-type ATPase [bacterium]|nr:cation-translocating P-type ATPase [bacterium]
MSEKETERMTMKPPVHTHEHEASSESSEHDQQGIIKKLFNRNEVARFRIDGMYCPDCASSIEASLLAEPGIREVTVSFAGEQGRIEYDPQKADLKAALKDLNEIGYSAHLTTDIDGKKVEKQRENMFLQLLVAAVFGMQVMLIYLTQLYPLYANGDFTSQNVRNLQYVVWALATPTLFIGGITFLRGGWRSLRIGKVGMNTLVSLGTLSAYTYSVYMTLTGGGEVYFDSVAMITTFIMLGRYLEKIGGAQARKDIRHLLKLQPDTAWIKVGDEWQETGAESLEAGDSIMVKPGERVPADAVVTENNASVDESLLTGESRPVHKAPGDLIFAGTIVADSALIGKVKQTGEATRLGQITQVVEHTLNQKPPIQRLADKASKFFAFGILGVAILTFFGWLLTGSSPSQALLNAVAVLVVACPCALGLATPLALAITLGKTAQNGILVRNPTAMELAAKVDRFVFDKTGTLTKGQLSVVDVAVDSSKNISADRMVCLAAAVEQFSEHPVGRAIVTKCTGSKPDAKEFESERGLGVSAEIDTNDIQGRFKIGSSRFVAKTEQKDLLEKAKKRSEDGETVVWVGWEGTVLGYISLGDEPEETAPKALDQLSKADVKTAMLSGDDPRTVKAIAAQLQMNDAQGGVGPTEKAEKIKTWQGDGELVAMIGDGVNDAPALAQADLSVTAASGTDVAGETSDIVLTRADLTLIPWLVQVSRRTRQIILENLGWAFAYNLVAVPLAAFGIISPVIAAAAMASSSLLVVGNSLRLKRDVRVD